MYCPHCQRPLPDPPERFCPHCGGDVQGAPAAAAVTGGSTPWENRDRLGFVNAFVETTKQVLLSPGEFFRRMPSSGGVGAPLGYGVLTGSTGLIVGALYQLVFQSVVTTWAGRLGEGGPLERLLPMMGQGLGFAVQIFLGPLLVLVGLFVATAIVHVFLMLFGGARRGFETTFRVACYAEATALLQIVPLCGGLIAAVWWIVAAIIGLSEAHGTGKGAAAAAVLVPMLLVCCCCAGAAALMFGGIAGLASRMQ